MMRVKTDCLIVGGGLAGWMAATQTAEAGLSTLMLHDGCGASPWVHGFNVPIRKGDGADIFFEDTLRNGQGLSRPELARALCYDAQDIFYAMQELGLIFNKDGEEYQALRPLGASFPRVVSIGNETGVAILKRLEECYGKYVQQCPATRAIRLLKEGERVAGALAYDKQKKEWIIVEAKAVILASGGYCGIYPFSTNKHDSGGDGIAMAIHAGAMLCDLEFIQFEPSGAVYPPALHGTSMITTLFFEGAVLRNRQGERFMLRHGKEGECVAKDILAYCIAAEIAQGNGTEHDGVYMDLTQVDAKTLQHDYGMYVERYANVGIDLTTEWIELAPAPHTSLGGVCIDADGRTNVEGLFACGEVIGGLHGANRIGGNAGLETLVFGRRAGRACAMYAEKASTIVPKVDQLPFGTPLKNIDKTLRTQMQCALQEGVGVVREEVTLASACEKLNDVLQETQLLTGASSQEQYTVARLYNDALCALLTAQAARLRTESLGCHIRSDATGEAEPCYRLTLKTSQTGEIEWAKERADT
ncbi:MAG: FAD-binding protein [Christensenellales bacterium]